MLMGIKKSRGKFCLTDIRFCWWTVSRAGAGRARRRIQMRHLQ